MVANVAEHNKTFSDFLIDFSLGKLFKKGVEVKLEPQTFELLCLLIRHAGKVVSREQILAKVWGDRLVTDDAIRAVIKKLRLALGDDARNPKFIKTLPLKGYLFIAHVDAVKVHNNKQKHHLIQYSVAIFLLALLLFFWRSSSETTQSRKTTTDIQHLTNMAGSELSSDYSHIKHALVYSHRSNNTDALNLYIKSLKTNRIQRLTWDGANYANAIWSPNGDMIVYTRSDKQGVAHYLIKLDKQNAVLDNTKIKSSLLEQQYVVGWSHNNAELYVKNAYRNLSTQGISRFNLDTETLKSITSPNVSGVGDYYAKESFGGRYLAILRAIDSDKHELLILDIKTDSLLVNRLLPQRASKLVWHRDDSRLVLSGFSGELFEYDIQLDKFINKQLNSPFVNDIIYACGNDCYFMRQHNGNFLDIQEQPNPFYAKSILSNDHIDLAGAEDYPLYSQDGESLYFVSALSDKLVLARQIRNNTLEKLLELPLTAKISALAINNQETTLLGVIGKRMFVYDIANQEFQYVSSDLESVQNPVWHQNGTSFYYASSANNIDGIYQYNLLTNTKIFLLANFVSLRQLNNGNFIAINNKLEAWLVNTNDEGQFKQIKVIASVGSANPHRWQIKNNNLYFTHRAGNNALMSKVDLMTGEKQIKQLVKNRFRLNFDMHPLGERMLIVKSLLAESNIIKVSLKRANISP